MNTNNIYPDYIGAYKIIGLLGEGGMGKVYIAEDPNIKRQVAIKVIHSSQTEYRKKIKQEAIRTAKLSHPNIIKIYESNYTAPTPYIVMEYHPGITLQKFLETNTCSLKQILDIAENILRGIEHAHAMNLVHRDLKPSNIMIDPSGENVKIMDFGLSKDLNITHSSSTTDNLVGTVLYMSPEQCQPRTATVDERSDIFSFGIIFFEMLTKKHPFVGTTLFAILDTIVYQPVQFPYPYSEHIPKFIQEICLKCLEKEKENRYPTARAVYLRIHKYLRQQKKEIAEKEKAKKEKKKRISYLIFSLYFFLLFLTILLFFRIFYLNKRQHIRIVYDVSTKQHRNHSTQKHVPTSKVILKIPKPHNIIDVSQEKVLHNWKFIWENIEKYPWEYLEKNIQKMEKYQNKNSEFYAEKTKFNYAQYLRNPTKNFQNVIHPINTVLQLNPSKIEMAFSGLHHCFLHDQTLKEYKQFQSLVQIRPIYKEYLYAQNLLTVFKSKYYKKNVQIKNLDLEGQQLEQQITLLCKEKLQHNEISNWYYYILLFELYFLKNNMIECEKILPNIFHCIENNPYCLSQNFIATQTPASPYIVSMFYLIEKYIKDKHSREEYLKFLSKCYALHPWNYGYDIAKIYVDKGNYRAALSFLYNVPTKDLNQRIYYLRIKCYLYLHQFKKGIQECNECQKITTSPEKVYLFYSKLYIGLQDFISALDYLEKVKSHQFYAEKTYLKLKILSLISIEEKKKRKKLFDNPEKTYDYKKLIKESIFENKSSSISTPQKK
ncbi:MAG TPA: protein kinase [Planctomycetota bacterium]|nr:protein kinase [Planctomycetota bacterium]